MDSYKEKEEEKKKEEKEEKEEKQIYKRIVVFDHNNSQLLCYNNFITPDLLEEYTKLALFLPLVHKPEIKVFGRICHQQRNVGFFGLPNVPGYKYSGQVTPVIPLLNHPFLLVILQKVNKALQSNYNGILVNLYEDGTNYISPHADNERDISHVGVASIAFGETRSFVIRYKHNKQIYKSVQHTPGSLFVMAGDFQKHFLHGIPKDKTVHPRVSLTFRTKKIKKTKKKQRSLCPNC